MTSSQLHYFSKVTEFLGRVMGPDYEVALHDISDRGGDLVAIANSHVSGRTIGAPATEKLMQIIETRQYDNEDFLLHEYGLTPNGKIICSSSMFIKDISGELIGVMCINFDDSRYRELSQKVFYLCHPDALVNTNFRFDESRISAKHMAEKHHIENIPDGNAADIIKATLREYNADPDTMHLKDKLRMIAILEEKGVFLIKGAVKDAAAAFGCSQATMYRHLSKIKE